MASKWCKWCNEHKNLECFSKNKSAYDGLQYYCRACHTVRLRELRDKAKQAGKPSYSQKSHARLRWNILSHYSKGDPKCQCCGESNHEFLAIDHINGGGNEHRKAIGGGAFLYRWLKKNNYPDGYRVLCHNCNQAIGLYGYCPHVAGSKPCPLSLSQESKLKILEAAQKLAAHGIYPSVPKIIEITGRGTTTVCNVRKHFIQTEEWPMLEETIKTQATYTPS